MFDNYAEGFLGTSQACPDMIDVSSLARVPLMRNIVLAVLTIGLIASLGGSANAADLYRYPYGWRSHVWYGGDCCGRAKYGPGIRVAEQVPYCGDCDNLVGPNTYNVALSYVGYFPWTRGCALGGCSGQYNLAVGCYWQEVPLTNGRGGWVRGVEKICN